MAKYLVLFTFHGETLKGFLSKPTDRAAVVDDAARSLGGALESYYWMFGQYSGLAILDLPDSRAAAALSLKVKSTGAFSQVETQELFSSDDIRQLVDAASGLAYTAPGESPEMYNYGMP